MKKIFTLLFAVGMVAVAQAQPGSRDNRDPRPIEQRNDDNRFGDDRDDQFSIDAYDRDIRSNDHGRFANERRMKQAINRINRDYDIRIHKVKNNYFMSRFEKQRQVRFLEQQRQKDLRMLMMTARQGRPIDGRDFPDNRRY